MDASLSAPDDLYAAMRSAVLEALRAAHPALPADALGKVEVQPTREAVHGDMATNAALVLAKPLRLPPATIASGLAERLRARSEVADATPAGPGFVNIRLREATLRALLPVILSRGESYGDSQAGQGLRTDVEYVSANPTGPMHVGHCRGAVVGDALANLLSKAGYAVTKEYYVNDAGAQVLALAYAAYWRYLQALGTSLTEEEYAQSVPGGLQYRGDYLIAVGAALAAEYGDSLAPGAMPLGAPDWLDAVRDFTVARMMEAIREDLAALGVAHDVFISERALVEAGTLDRAEELLRERDLI